MTRLNEHWDNDDVRVRAARSSRPRTKTRPGHVDAVRAMVVAVDRGRYTCVPAGGAVITAMRAREVGRGTVVVGDDVDLVGDTTGRPDSLARIVRIAERRSVLRRSADDTDPTERLVVANADNLVIVCAAADPVPRAGFIDRCLVAAYAGHLTPVLVLTKTDLSDPGALLADYADLDLQVVRTARPGGKNSPIVGLSDLTRLLRHRSSVLFGHSGVGKSTLVNQLVPDARRAIGTVTAVGKGRHTSSSAVALALPGGGWVIDTPGVRSLGLAHVDADDVLIAFDDLLPASADCPPNCTHLGAEAGGGDCALDRAVADGAASPARLQSFRRLLRSLTGDDK